MNSRLMYEWKIMMLRGRLKRQSEIQGKQKPKNSERKREWKGSREEPREEEGEKGNCQKGRRKGRRGKCEKRRYRIK